MSRHQCREPRLLSVAEARRMLEQVELGMPRAIPFVGGVQSLPSMQDCTRDAEVHWFGGPRVMHLADPGYMRLLRHLRAEVELVS